MRSRKRDFSEVAFAECNLFANRKRNPIKKTEDLRIQSETPENFCGVLLYGGFSFLFFTSVLDAVVRSSGFEGPLGSHFENENKLESYKNNETWTLNLETIRALETFERKALRTIFGSVKDQGCWRTRYNFELYRLYKEPQVTQVIRSNRLRWLGHIWRSPENNQSRAYIFKNPMGSRTRGRPPTSDEAHFWLNGYVNKQNCRIWSEANPQVYVETPLHPEKLTVWCALWAGGILLQKR
ncbi:endonuclease-reverse transcriptase [Trichonephila clavipes]|uniref:Endonuclease-reverse transcriptase n=1 Tax=Trichonephila clavipes TaxID=2585209 RepID=A0A8X6RY12_TRICX|nr:endonuclease-reverse transcriptase [Trichonephila clavipes]